MTKTERLVPSPSSSTTVKKQAIYAFTHTIQLSIYLIFLPFELCFICGGRDFRLCLITNRPTPGSKHKDTWCDIMTLEAAVLMVVAMVVVVIIFKTLH